MVAFTLLRNSKIPRRVARGAAPAWNESCGAYAREDFPKRDDQNWMKHTPVWADEKTHLTRIAHRPVHICTLSNDVEYIKPKARMY